MKDHESTDLEGAEHFAATDMEVPDRPSPSEYADLPILDMDEFEDVDVGGGGKDSPSRREHQSAADVSGLYQCPTCEEGVRIFGQRCPRCKASMEWDRLERESGR